MQYIVNRTLKLGDEYLEPGDFLPRDLGWAPHILQANLNTHRVVLGDTEAATLIRERHLRAQHDLEQKRAAKARAKVVSEIRSAELTAKGAAQDAAAAVEAHEKLVAAKDAELAKAEARLVALRAELKDLGVDIENETTPVVDPEPDSTGALAEDDAPVAETTPVADPEPDSTDALAEDAVSADQPKPKKFSKSQLKRMAAPDLADVAIHYEISLEETTEQVIANILKAQKA